MLARRFGLVQVVVVLVVGMRSLQVVSLLDVLHLVLNTRVEGVVALRWRGGMVHNLPLLVFVLLQLERVGSLIVVISISPFMSALKTHTSNQFREKRKRKETNEKLKQVIKTKQKPRKDHLREKNLGSLRQGQRLNTTEIKCSKIVNSSR
jgi:membrane protein required for beta-lactamase induction